MTFWQSFRKAWSGYGHFIGNVVGRVALTLFYFTVMLPFSIGVTLFGDPLKLKRKSEAHWLNRTETITDLEQARQQS